MGASPAPPRRWSRSSTRAACGPDWTTTSLQGFGWRATEWDLQGVPIRVEIGPRELAENAVVALPAGHPREEHGGLDSVVDEVQRLTGRIQTDMLEAATARRDAFISDCTTLDQARDVAQTGVARLPWELVGTSGEEDLAASGLTVRCLQRERRVAARHRRRRGCDRLRRPGLLKSPTCIGRLAWEQVRCALTPRPAGREIWESCSCGR